MELVAAQDRRVGVMSRAGQERHLREREDSARGALGGLPCRATRSSSGRLAQIHEIGMTPEEIGGKVLRAIQRNDFYIFSHPEFKEELRALFDEALAAIPDDEPVPAQRLAFEEGRRERNANARAAWPKL